MTTSQHEVNLSPEVQPDGVGLTAIGMAYTRALEVYRADPLFDDPLSADFFLSYATATDPRGWLLDSLSLRTRFFDDLVTQALARGVRQVVVLAAGLDARPYRMKLPEDVHWFELDQPALMAFKEHVLGRSGRTPNCRRSTIGVDLRQDWPTALDAAGLRKDEPVVWLAEGLLHYLTLEEARVLLTAVAGRSAAGSEIVFDHVNQAFVDLPEFSGAVSQLDLLGASFRSALEDPADWLGGIGWSAAEVTHFFALAAQLGRRLPNLPADEDAAQPRGWLIRAVPAPPH